MCATLPAKQRNILALQRTGTLPQDRAAALALGLTAEKQQDGCVS